MGRAGVSTTTERPGSPEEAAALLRSLGEERRTVRVRGGGTKLDWGGAAEPPDVELLTAGLDEIAEHNVGDFTAVLEAGVPVATAQKAFHDAGQMLALDPPLGRGGAATVGGLVATADSGPLRHRYGGVRDLVVGITVALSDGTLANAGGKVIKNVAGYDLGKLFAGSYGTLGLIVSVAVRLHPYPERTATVVGSAGDPDRLAAAARELAAHPLEADSLDAAWSEGAGRVLARFGGAAAERQAEAVAPRLRDAGLEDVEVIADDDELWMRQRLHQRAPGDGGVALKVSARPADLAAACRAADGAGAALVGRAALGLLWLTLEGADLAERVARIREALAPRACVLLDAPADVRAAADPWGSPAGPEAGAVALMARVKERFDPARIFRPGAFVGGI
jgi:glycolate oxidase FAD binding subunit